MGKGGQKSETSKQAPTRKTKAAVDRRQSNTVTFRHKLQALVCDSLPSTTAVFSYAIGSRKLSANEQFFVGVHTVVSLLQSTQIKQGVSFIAANKVYTSTNKTTIVSVETELFFFTRGRPDITVPVDWA